MIKAVFFDIDGTLVSFKTHVVPKSTLHAIELLKKKGIKVFIATGRHRRSINNLGDLEFDGYVTLNGGYVFAGKDDVIYKHSIPDKDIEALVRYQEKEGEFPCAFVQEDEIFMNYTDKAVNDVFHLLNFPAPPILNERLSKDLASNPSDRGYLWKDGLPVDRLFYGRAGETYYEGLVAL